MLETLDYAFRIGSTPTILYFDLYLYSAYTAHYVYCKDKQVSTIHTKWLAAWKFKGKLFATQA